MKGDKFAQRFSLNVRNIAAGEKHDEVFKVQEYLKKFGYLKDGFQPGVLDALTQNALRIYQERAGLVITGDLNPETANKLEEPRCGVPDVSPSDPLMPFDEPPFRPGCKYENKEKLSYAIIKKSSSIAEHDAGILIRAAFDSWQSLIPVDFTDGSPNPVLTMGWFTGDHGDGAGFNSTGNVFAHAFPPPKCGDPYAGMCHFNDYELWSDVPGNGYLGLQVIALHEIGHLLGLPHVNQPTSIMNEHFARNRPYFLRCDIAIPMIQEKYGHRPLALVILISFEGAGDQLFRANLLAPTKQRIKGFQIEFESREPPELSLRYRARIDNVDSDFVGEGEFLGTRDPAQAGQISAFAVELIGPQADKYNVFYRAKIQDVGVTPISSNGSFCGHGYQSKPIDSLQVWVELKT